ncbi:hypothetical protein BGZ61DRAFT_519273 [Ilyonectria robusta]|uniref:uncharacterized protein n=1 Tax=Ilyonectria robusta TaxID=1079257 RepID=UPI001E8EA518|nr:uncharacterized protein BGZ61DRAFT_519273 [Ilyonectria robusta]KAH8684967.1 hypothetical protein BGZ61DRAFT_519273 [Ilyonectria robusta]
MRFSVLAIFAAGPLLAVAKDCAVFYKWSGTSNLDVWRDLKAVSMCEDIGGNVANNEVGIKNRGSETNKCTVCRGARSSTRDYDRTITQGSASVPYSVRCGYYQQGQCYDKL